MNHSEYHKKSHPELYRRSWPYTIISFILFILVAGGTFAAWRYLDHDSYLILTVILPSSLIALVLLLAALNGRKGVIKGILDSLFQLVYFWP